MRDNEPHLAQQACLILACYVWVTSDITQQSIDLRYGLPFPFFQQSFVLQVAAYFYRAFESVRWQRDAPDPQAVCSGTLLKDALHEPSCVADAIVPSAFSQCSSDRLRQ